MLKNINPGTSQIYSLKNNQNLYVMISTLGKCVIIPVISYFCLSRFVVSVNARRSVNSVNYIIFTWTSFIVKKIKFKHKITWFYIKRNCSQLVKFKLGFSHMVLAFLPDVRVRRHKKYLRYHTLVIWGLNPYFVNLTVRHIYCLQPVNTFTLRGFRYSRQRLFKRVGKVNKYSGIKKSF